MKRIDKPWGYELLITCNEHYALKDIWMKKGTRSSLQSHQRKIETILVVSGVVSLEKQVPGGPLEIFTYGPGDAYDIPANVRHRVTVIEDARLIEASTPELDDIVRHADDFGRT